MTSIASHLCLAALFVAAPLASSTSAAPGGDTTRASVSVGGGDTDGWSRYADLSADGRYAVFESVATDLVPGDTNGGRDVFVRDLAAGTTVRASIPAGGGQGNGSSSEASISADGRYVVFVSGATNMVPGDNNHALDVFRRDLVTGTTIRVSVAWDGSQADSDSDYPSISADGRYVAFTSRAGNLVPQDTRGFWDTFVRDVDAGTTEWVSYALGGGKADGGCLRTDLSGDGRYVAFSSSAANLVAGETSDTLDVYHHDRVTGTTLRASADQFGGQANNYSRVPEISGDGRYVVFESAASDLVPGDTNLAPDCFLFDSLSGATERVSLGEDGQEPNGSSSEPSVSADGRFVAFGSRATNLLPVGGPGWRNIFVRDRATGRLVRVSVDSSGVPPNNHCEEPSISGDGAVVVFSSFASNLVPSDGNGQPDVFAHDRDVVGCGASLASVETPRSGTPPNPTALLPGQTSGPVIGATWDPMIDHAAFLPGASLDLIGVTFAPANLPLAPYGTLLIDVVGSPLFTFSSPASAPFAIPLPSDCALAGVSLSSQGASLEGATVRWTNALDLVLGTF